ncbi:MAG: acyltransferase [Proteobacteria bacterium]|nr:acyltransferase [Pseudomonadota bacterium]
MIRIWGARVFESLRRVARGVRLLLNPTVQRALAELSSDAEKLGRLRAAFPTCFVDRGVVLHGAIPEAVRLGHEVRLAHGVVLGLSEDANGGVQLCIGDHTYIGEYGNLRAAPGTRISIGSHCLIAQFCSLLADHHARPRGTLISAAGIESARRGVTIGDDVWLGADVCVLAGVVIGDGAVIGANSVVNCSVPPYEVWAGSPARKIGERR